MASAEAEPSGGQAQDEDARAKVAEGDAQAMAEDAPLVSVVMPCRNAMPYLPWAVDDLARCGGCRLEVLVCDDGSTDASGEWLRSLHGEVAKLLGREGDEAVASKQGPAEDDPANVHGESASSLPAPPAGRSFVAAVPWPGEGGDATAAEGACAAEPPTVGDVAARLVAASHSLKVLPGHGRGQGAAQNLCLQHATSELVSLMDADDRCTPDRFERLLAARKKEWDAVCSGVKIFGKVSSGMARYVDWQNSLQSPEDVIQNRFVEIPAIHQTTLFRRDLIRERLGGYRDLPCWPIDMDTWMRLGEQGVRIGKIPDKLYGWRQHDLQSTRNHGKCGLDHLRRCKAHYLLRALPAGVAELEVWSVGNTLELWGRALLEEAPKVRHFEGGYLAAVVDPPATEAARPEKMQACSDLAGEPPAGPAAEGGGATARTFVLRLVDWKPKKRARGGAHQAPPDLPQSPTMEELARAIPAVVERTATEPGAVPPQQPPRPAGTGQGSVARVFVFGNEGVRDRFRQAVGGAKDDSGEPRWGMLDWPAA